MSRLKVDAIIRFFKKDVTYTIDANLKGRRLLQLLTYRGSAILRAQWHRIWLANSKKELFIGSQVVLRYPQLISLGRSVILEDFVTIDAISKKGVTLGHNVTIGKYSTIQCTGVVRNLGIGLKVGNYSAIGAYSFIGAQGGIEIGSNVLIGPRVSFHAENHRFNQIGLPIRLQGETREGIVVEDDCWIGGGSVILDGVRISCGSVIAAGSVVTRDVPEYSVAAGIPARVIKQRK